MTAAELAKKGYKVLGLERGKDQDTEDFIGSKDELRYSVRGEMYSDLTKETVTVRNNSDETAYPKRADQVTGGTDTGGTSAHFNGYIYRFFPYDFEIRSKTIEKYGEDKIPDDMTVQDWGITYDEIEPYYDKFEKAIGVSGSSEDMPHGPERSDEYPNPPMKDTPMLNLFKKAARELDLHPYHIPSANMSQNYENPDGETLNACVYCSFCEGYGCDFDAKASPINTVLRTAKKTDNYEVRNHAYVNRVVHDGDKATGVLFTDTQTGEEFEQPADVVVLAAFVWSNTRLMLLSEIGKPYDPETGQGVIGKNFTGHYPELTYDYVDGFFEDKKFNSFAGAGTLGAAVEDYGPEQLDHYELDFLHGFKLTILQSGNRPIGSNNVPEGTPSWGKEFKEKSLHYANRHIAMTHHEGVLPRKHNYLDLDSNYKDAFGDPLLRTTVKYTDQERNLMNYANQKAKELVEQMGADIIDVPEINEDTEYDGPAGGSHFGGGVIMGDDPETSAVNNYSQVWDMENLFVVGSSAFPHFGNANPSGTIGALAYRAAEGMIEYLEGDGGLLVDPVEEKEESKS
ncbi:GMC family oxidoreductase [Virgibacillus saliphilus]|uniref:GMC family oxidoreductase n=1 Tax=Virgibacillus saliphilus TaxID=2831674 RepID=UPI004056C636